MNETEGGGRDGEVGARGRESDAVGKGNTEGGKGMSECIIICIRLGAVGRLRVGLMDRDMGDPAQRKPNEGFDERNDMPDWIRKTTRQEVIVAHIKARWGRQRNRIRGYKVPRPKRADVPRLSDTCRIEHKLLDGRLCARVVDDEEVGRRPVARRVDLHAEGVKVVCGGVSLECHAVNGVRAGDVKKEVTTRIGISEGTHHGVPGFSVWVAAKEHEAVGECALGVVMIPEGDVLAKVDVVRGRIFDDRTVRGPVAADIVGVWEVGGGEDVVPGNAATAVDENSL